MDSKRARALLRELTGLPTAAGREDAVVRFVRGWAKRKRRLRLREDAAGNLVLAAADEPAGGEPVLLVAHMDHPAAVVAEADPATPKRLRARFLGGVRVEAMKGGAVRLHRDRRRGTLRGRVVEAASPGPPPGAVGPGERPDPELAVAFGRPHGANPGDVLTWDLGGPAVRGTRLHAPACDDLAGVAAALATLEAVARRRGPAEGAPLRVLLTRAEEVGFVGAIAACRLGTIPAGAGVVVLECSKASDDAPIGAGPVVRVGDRTSTFDPELTASIAAAAADLASEGAAAGAGKPTDRNAAASFRWQRKLMTGGTCEATAYAAFGHRAACICLPLGNYHNMSDEDPDRLAREVISLNDFDGMLRLLERLPQALAGPADAGAAGFRGRLDAIHARREDLLRPIPG